MPWIDFTAPPLPDEESAMNAVQKPLAKARQSAAKRFTKPTITPLGFLRDVAAIAAERSVFSKVWVKRELDPAFRETLMVAIARMNDSKYCSWAHHEWALIEGVSEQQLSDVEKQLTTRFDARTKAALRYVQELVAHRFGKVSAEVSSEMSRHFSNEEIEEVKLVAKVMDFANRSSNTFDAFVSRLAGKPSANGRLMDELIMSAAFVCAVPPLVTYFARASETPAVDVVGRLVDYTRKMEADYQQAAVAPAKPKARKPATPRKKAAAATAQA
jgi:AhpD family alkylhydroperoxidase